MTIMDGKYKLNVLYLNTVSRYLVFVGKIAISTHNNAIFRFYPDFESNDFSSGSSFHNLSEPFPALIS